jgi:hypothetical protein
MNEEDFDGWGSCPWCERMDCLNDKDFDCCGTCEGCERMACLNKYNACKGCHYEDEDNK